MGGDLDWPDDEIVMRATHEGLSEWEATVRGLTQWPAEKIAKYVQYVLILPEAAREGRKPHAYADEDLTKLLRLLRVDAGIMSLERLHRWTDLFAIFIGVRATTTPRSTIAQQQRLFREGVIEPARRLQKALASPDMEYTFRRSGTLPDDVTLQQMQGYLKQMENAAATFAKSLDARKRQGKQWYHDLCRQHVYLCDIFFEFLNESVEPARTKGIHCRNQTYGLSHRSA
jgi:hypothetical protein